MSGKLAVVTGATSGIGLATAIGFAELGASVHLVGRDEQRVAAAVSSTRDRGDGVIAGSVTDLSSPRAAAALGAELVATYPAIDALIHSAGALNRSFTMTPDGFESTVATQVLSPYALTSKLAPALLAAKAAAIVMMSSGGMYTKRFDLAALQPQAMDYDGVATYSSVKRAQVVLAAAWSDYFATTSLRSFSMHPGWVDTPGLSKGLPRFSKVMKSMLRNPAEGADTAVWLGSGGGNDTDRDGFYLDRRARTDHRGWIKAPTRAARAELLDWCAQQTGLLPSESGT